MEPTRDEGGQQTLSEFAAADVLGAFSESGQQILSEFMKRQMVDTLQPWLVRQSDMDEAIGNMAEQLDKDEDCLVELRHDLQTSKAGQDGLAMDLKKANDRCSSLQEALVTANRERQVLQQRLEETQAELGRSQSKQEDLDNSIRELQRAAKDHDREMGKLAANVDEISTFQMGEAMTALETVRRDLDELSKRHDRTCATVKERNALLEQHNTCIREQHETCIAHSSQLKELRVDHTHMSERWESANISLEELDSTMKRFQRNYRTTEADVRVLKGMMTESESGRQALSDALDKHVSHINGMFSPGGRVLRNENTVSQLKVDVDNLRQMLDENASGDDEVEARVDALSDSVLRCEARLQKSERQADEYDKMFVKMDDKFTKHDSRASESAEAHHQMVIRVQSLADEFKKTSILLRCVREELESTNNDVEALKRGVSTNRQTIANFSTSMNVWDEMRKELSAVVSGPASPMPPLTPRIGSNAESIVGSGRPKSRTDRSDRRSSAMQPDSGDVQIDPNKLTSPSMNKMPLRSLKLTVMPTIGG